MIHKHRISTKIGQDQKVVVELKQDYDLLEILSLKFTQKEVYASLCADYGVVCGRITANNGLGIPNAKISIFIPQQSADEDDPVISALYPYKITTDRNEDNYRYNLLPKRQQHGGHTPTGTFFDQEDILSREEVLEVYEKYYNYTVKTNTAGDFMIWGVPIGTQTIHVDIDLSDMGCFSLRPYDFIRQGIGPDKFDRFYNFKASDDIDGLPQIVSFTKTIEVYPFWGNEELCELGITRVDFDLSDRGIQIQPIALILMSSVTDTNATAIKRNGVIKREQGFKCNLQTAEGAIQCVRFTGKKVYGSDNTTLYPELEYFNISEGIDGDGSSMIVLPMNMEYLFTNEFGEEEITNDPNKGVPTTTIARFKFNLSFSDRKKTTATFLVPNIREYNNDPNGLFTDENDEHLLTTYQFSDKFEDYLTITEFTPSNPMSSQYKEDKKKKMTGEDNNNIPEDYFYKFIFGKIYTVSSFQGSYFRTSDGKIRKNAFLGIKEIRPSVENDCASNTNYFPVNFAFRNRIKFNLILSQFLLFIQYITTLISVKFYEVVATALWSLGIRFGNVWILGSWGNAQAERFVDWALKMMERGQKTLPLIVYPDCEPCSSDEDAQNVNSIFDDESNFYRSAEVKVFVVPQDGFINLVFLPSQSPSWFRNSTTTGTTFLTDIYPNDAARVPPATGITQGQLTSLHFEYLYDGLPVDTAGNNRFAAAIYPLPENEVAQTFQKFNVEIRGESQPGDAIGVRFVNKSVQFPYNTKPSIRVFVVDSFNINVSYVDAAGTPITATEDILVQLLIRDACSPAMFPRNVTILNGQSTTSYSLQGRNCAPPSPPYIFPPPPPPPPQYGVEKYERIISISGSTSGLGGIPPYNTNTNLSYTGPTLEITISDWAKYGNNYFENPQDLFEIQGLYAVVRIYDLAANNTGNTNNEIIIEEGCEKYDKFYDESFVKTYIWSKNNTSYSFPKIDFPSNQNYKSPTDNSNKIVTYGADEYRTSFNYGAPIYTGSLNDINNTPSPENFIESKTSPGPEWSLLSAVAGYYNTIRLPNYVYYANLGWKKYYSKKTKSGLSEIRDGVVTIVPTITINPFGDSANQYVIKEWYRRKRIGLFFCGGVTNYSFIDNWLNGLLYFFKFDRRIKWDNRENYDLNKRSSKYPRDLVFFNVIDENFYYRSTPYDPTNEFKGQTVYTNTRYEILHPTTFYDVGVRDEFLKEICIDQRLDPTCSVIRDIGVTSYQDVANVVEYAINYRLDVGNADVKLETFFDGAYLNNNYIKAFDGDINQLMSINTEAGIEAFDLDSPHYFIYNGELMDPEDPIFDDYFKNGANYGPTPIDLKFDDNGKFIRECLNFRLGDYSQVVPFYLWDKQGSGFGPGGPLSNTQEWDTSNIASMKLQRIFSLENYGDTTTNYVFADGEEEYLLRPMTKNHDTFVFTGNTNDNFALERFEVISDYAPDVSAYGASAYTEGNLWLHVKSGSTVPVQVYSGVTYVVKNSTWTRDVDYIKDLQEIFLFSTLNNYIGDKQALSTPFHFYFGLRPGKTAFDTLIKYFGPKLPRTAVILTGATGTTEPPALSPTPSPSPTPTATISPTVTPTVTPSSTPLSGPFPTPSVTPTVTTTPSLTPSISITPTVTPSNEPSPSLTPTLSITPSITPSVSVTPSLTPSLTPTPSSCACVPGDPTGNIVPIGDDCYTEYYNCDCTVYYSGPIYPNCDLP